MAETPSDKTEGREVAEGDELEVVDVQEGGAGAQPGQAEGAENLSNPELPLKQYNVLIAGIFDEDHITAIKRQLKEFGAKNVHFAQVANDAIKRLGDNKIDIMLYDGILGGPSFIQFVSSYYTEIRDDADSISCIISSDKISEHKEHNIQSAVLDELQDVLLPKIYALIVHKSTNVREKVQQCLEGAGVSAGKIQIAENTEIGQELVTSPITDVVEINGGTAEVEEDVSLAFVQDGVDGAKMAVRAWQNEVYPYIVAIKGPDDPGINWEDLGPPDNFSAIDVDSLSPADVKRIIPQAKRHLKGQKRQQYEKARTVVRAFEEREIALATPLIVEAPTIIIPKGCYYENVKQLPDLRSPEYQNHLAAVLDLDGTLSDAFTMARFIESFTTPQGESEFDRLLNELPKEFQERNRKALEDLNEKFDEWREMKKVGRKFTHQEYINFIETTDNLFAKVMQDLRAIDVFMWGEKWCKGDFESRNGNGGKVQMLGDAEQHVWSHARPLIGLLKKVHIMPTLITGTPAEAVSGFRSVLGIDERCHAMELYIDSNGRYTGNVKHHTGLPRNKATLMAKIGKVVFAAGDQQSDYPLLDRSLSVKNDGLQGFGVFFGDPGLLKDTYSDEYKDLLVRDISVSDLSGKGIIELIVERMQGIMSRNLDRKLDAQTEKLVIRSRDKLEELVLNRTLIDDHMAEYRSVA